MKEKSKKMRQREGFERISIESPIEKRLKERLKKLAELHKRSVNKEVLYLLERTLKLEEEKLKAG